MGRASLSLRKVHPFALSFNGPWFPCFAPYRALYPREGLPPGMSSSTVGGSIN